MKPSTAAFYADVFRVLLMFAPLAHSRLDRTDEALIARYVQSLLPSIAGWPRYGVR